MALGHARRIRLPIPVFRSMAFGRQEQVRGRARHARREPSDLELLLRVERLVLVGSKVSDQRAVGRGEERVECGGSCVSSWLGRRCQIYQVNVLT